MWVLRYDFKSGGEGGETGIGRMKRMGEEFNRMNKIYR